MSAYYEAGTEVLGHRQEKYKYINDYIITTFLGAKKNDDILKWNLTRWR